MLAPRRFASVFAVAITALQLTVPCVATVAQATTAPPIPKWSDGFEGRGAPLPPPCQSCQVCFYQKPSYQGDRFCVGRRTADTSDFLMINAPSTIGSIEFTSSNASLCDLVVNLRVLDPPYGRHFESYSNDVTDTKYDNVVQELYVETAGRACFTAALEIDDYGKCYDSSVRSVEQAYRNGFYEALLFESDRKQFDVVVYEKSGFTGLSKRLNESTSDLNVPTSDAEEAPDTLQMRIRSIKFIPTPATTAKT